MKDRQIALNEFLEKIVRIERELDGLEDFAYDISQLYNGDNFPEQEKLSVNTLENLMIAATHETASQIGFYRNDIENLAKFIEFRELYREFTDNELAEIVDGTLTLEQKRSLSGRFDTPENMIIRLNELKGNWNKTFENCDYLKLKKQLRV